MRISNFVVFATVSTLVVNLVVVSGRSPTMFANSKPDALDNLFSPHTVAAMQGVQLGEVPARFQDTPRCCIPSPKFSFNSTQTQTGNVTQGGFQMLEGMVDGTARVAYFHIDGVHTNLNNYHVQVWQVVQPNNTVMQYIQVDGQSTCYYQDLPSVPDILVSPFCTPAGAALAGTWIDGSALRLIWINKNGNLGGEITATTSDSCIPTFSLKWGVNDPGNAGMLSVLQAHFHNPQLYIRDPSKLVVPSGCKPLPPQLGAEFANILPAHLK
jgi:hypothetical protein